MVGQGVRIGRFFLPLWMGVELVAVVAGVFLGKVVSDAIGMTGPNAVPLSPDTPYLLYAVRHTAVRHTLPGLAVGIAQWLFLRPYIPQAHWWAISTIVGWTVGGLVPHKESRLGEGALIPGITWTYTVAFVAWSMVGAVTGLVEGIWQGQFLGRRFRLGGQWTPICTVAMTLGFGLAYPLERAAGLPVAIVSNHVLIGGITGLAMWRILQGR
ncbi:MAG: hypothetical protein AB1791_10000 [Chloroflexota bacterium]